jgi:hypothetical protein
MKMITKTLTMIGLLVMLLGIGGLLFGNYLTQATAQRNPALDIAAATNKIATDPFATGPSLGDTLVVILAIIGGLAILAVIGYIIHIRQRRRQYEKEYRQAGYHPRAQPQIASTQSGVGDALNALVQLETMRYLRSTQSSGPQQTDYPIVQHLDSEHNLRDD